MLSGRAAALERENRELERLLEAQRRNAALKAECEAAGVQLPWSTVIREAVEVAAMTYRIDPEVIYGRTRNKRASWARHSVWSALRACLNAQGQPRFSFPQIAAAFDRDHSTVVHGVHAHATRLQAGLVPLPEAPAP